MMIVPVILAGGSGSRLWPLSRSAYPKQLLPLIDNRTMLQDTLLRVKGIHHILPPLIICNQEHRFLVTEQVQNIGVHDATIIIEPVGKNTAPAIAIASFYYRESDPILLILPTDHVIKDTDRFAKIVTASVPYAQGGKLVTFGIKPTKPETGYGYIKISHSLNNHAYLIEQFVEKPDLNTAKQYCDCGQYYWNSGIYMFKVSQYLSELNQYEPTISKICEQSIAHSTKDLNFIRLNEDVFTKCPNGSIDYIIMEKTKNSVLVPLQTDWNDVGSWSALCDIQEKNQDGNVFQGDIITEEVKNSYLRAESRMLAVAGVSDHIIIETPDAVLVAHKTKSQAVKNIVDRLKKNRRSEVDLHQKIYRPWGCYEILCQSECFQVKRLTIKPRAKLSLQMHHQRSEHWIVVSGTAQVIRDKEKFSISKNESTYIPIGMKHRLLNLTDENLEIIEVQLGHYLGEDDIIRFEDSYGRVDSSFNQS